MAGGSVGNTALGTAVCRQVEQYIPEESRLFNDPVVQYLVGGFYRWLLRSAKMRRFLIDASEVYITGTYGAQVCRTCYIDDATMSAIRDGIEQVVILGAGMDSRAYRLSGIEKARIFEVDLPEVQEVKKRRLTAHLDKIPDDVVFLAADFNLQTMESIFSRSSFDPAKATLFIWEGVTQYITAEAVAKTLAFIGGCAQGNRVVFTYVLRWIIDDPLRDAAGAKLQKYLKLKGIRWIFGLEPDELPDYLSKFHLKIIEDVGKKEHEERYLKPAGRRMDVSAGERICLAQVHH